MIEAGHPSVELIFGEDDVSGLAFSICDNLLSIKEITIVDFTDYGTKCLI